MEVVSVNLLAGWIGMLGGAVSGAILGLFFQDESWMGGYSSFRRRLTRLGHISFFGIGFLNLMCGFTVAMVDLPEAAGRLASAGFLLGAVTMPICCFLAAWRKPFRHLFPIPVSGVLVGILSLLAGLGAP